MSHFTTIHTQIQDIEALRAACSELGLTLCANTTARGYSGNSTPGEFAIRLRGPYDIALNRLADGSYGMTTDWWNGHVAGERKILFEAGQYNNVMSLALSWYFKPRDY